ncbi:S8 family peptidase [Dyella tabacisoli]|uniref:Serine protease n=1 Tax=Dyella tabacisoli TaxID=2282381 RepID=A0A369UMM2_9GAMM|nr:S8 family serine peptidase [Dyella tabacisoli]RDD80840.1 serine protease [Dyella tabacisoli]
MPKLNRVALAFSLSTLLGTATATDLSAALAPGQLSGNGVSSAISAKDRASGSNAKLDNALLNLKQRATAAPSAPASSSSTHATRRLQAAESYVTVDVIAKGDAKALQAQLEKLGFQTTAVFHNDIGGRLPVSQIDNAAALSGVLRISVPEKHTRAGNVRSQGDSAQHSKLLRDTYTIRPATRAEPKPPHVDGTGITIGVISDSFNCADQQNQQNVDNPNWVVLDTQADDVASDDLPAAVNVVNEASDCRSGTDEGRAMAQIVHDVAPGARIAFYSPDTMADFAQGIQTLALPTNKTDANGRHGAGAQIVVDDLGFFAEPLYQEGIIGEAIDEVAKAHGTAYFSAAGNAANHNKAAYDNNGPAFAAAAVTRAKLAKMAPLNLGERLINFDASGKSTLDHLPVTIGSGSADTPNTATFAVFWDQPMTGANARSSLDLCLGNSLGNPLGNNLCSGPTVVGQPAQAILQITNKGAAIQGSLRLGLAAGVAPGRVHILILGGDASINRYGTDTGSIYGHPLSPNAAAIGAADYFKTPFCNAKLATATLEPYSSVGGLPFLFNADGSAIAKPTTPQKPEFVAPDGVSTNFFGMASLDAGAANAAVADCRSYPDYLNDQFYGTSAAAPHAAAAAALLWQAAPTATATDLYSALKSSALDMESPGFDYKSGSGFLRADQALATLQAQLKKAKAKKP